ncbi:MAG: hypothetical protein AB7L91_19515 [Dehalococcoidia bacterium]
MRRIVAAALLLGLMACGESGPEAPAVTRLSAEDARDMHPSYSPDRSKVAFWRLTENGVELWVANADLEEARSLGATTLDAQFSPIWTPDGQHLVIAGTMRGGSDVAVIDVADGTATWLTTGPNIKVPFQVLPDGDGIVYIAYREGGTFGMYRVSRATGESTPLVDGLDRSHLGQLSPDGSQVIYAEFDQGRSNLWSARSDGGERRQLTTEGFEFFDYMAPGGMRQAWSPDGKAMLYESRRTGKQDIWVLGTDGTSRQLTTDINDDYRPVWSPDGEWIAFLSNRGRQVDVWVMPATGGDAVRVTDDPIEEQWVQWTGPRTLAFSAGRSPGSIWEMPVQGGSERRVTPDSLDAGDKWLSHDGTRVAFKRDHPGGRNDLVVMPVAGGSPRTFSPEANHGQLLWSDDDRRVAFEVDRTGEFDVWVADLGGEEPPRQLTDWQGFETVAGWAPGGRAVLLLSPRDAKDASDLWEVPLEGAEATRRTTRGDIVTARANRGGASAGIFIEYAEPATGEIVLDLLRSDGSTRRLTGENPNWLVPSPTGDRVAAQILAGGTNATRILGTDGRVLATLPQSFPSGFSRDGTRLLFQQSATGGSDIGVYDIASGTRTMLTSTPESEGQAEFGPGDSTIVFRRVKITEEVMRADLTKVLARGRE